MRVAFVTPFMLWPADTGGKLRSYYLLRGLAERHTVDLFTVFRTPQPPDPGPVSDMCRRIELVRLVQAPRCFERLHRLLSPYPRLWQHFHTPRALHHVRSELLRGYDLVICDEFAMFPYVAHLPTQGVPLITAIQKVDWAHYLEVAQARPWGIEKLLDGVEAFKLRRAMARQMPRSDGLVVCSADDEALLKTSLPTMPPTCIIINGADTDLFTPAHRRPAPDPTVMFMGTMSYYPNVDAMRYFFAEMYARLRRAVPNVRLLIVGQNPLPEIRALAVTYPNVVVTGRVPDVRPYLDESHLFIVPLRLGGGTRLKIVEAMAAGLPVVSTTIGAQGLLDAAAEGALALADTPEAFVGEIVRLLEHPEEAAEMARRARRIAEARYSWRSLGAAFTDFCEQIVASKQTLEERIE